MGMNGRNGMNGMNRMNGSNGPNGMNRIEKPPTALHTNIDLSSLSFCCALCRAQNPSCVGSFKQSARHIISRGFINFHFRYGGRRVEVTGGWRVGGGGGGTQVPGSRPPCPPPSRAPPPPPPHPPLAPHPISPRCPPRRAASARGLAGAPLEPVGRGWGGKAGAPAEARGRARDGAEFF